MNKTSPFNTTPLSEEEKSGLRLTHITNQQELNRYEQNNILLALDWLARKKPTVVLNEPFIKKLHLKMFEQVWKWAGLYRQSEKNIGIPWQFIAVEVKKLCDNTKYQIKQESYSQRNCNPVPSPISSNSSFP